MSWYSDGDLLAEIVAQTAQFRYRICWAGARRLLEGRGIDALLCLLLRCDQGDDVSGTLVLPRNTECIEMRCCRRLPNPTMRRPGPPRCGLVLASFAIAEISQRWRRPPIERSSSSSGQ